MKMFLFDIYCYRVHGQVNIIAVRLTDNSVMFELFVLLPVIVLLCTWQVYKTSILIFKDRDKYVSGEFRYVCLIS